MRYLDAYLLVILFSLQVFVGHNPQDSRIGILLLPKIKSKSQSNIFLSTVLVWEFQSRPSRVLPKCPYLKYNYKGIKGQKTRVKLTIK